MRTDTTPSPATRSGDGTGERDRPPLPLPRRELTVPVGERRPPYTARRFLRELGIAAGILAVGLPVVLVATSGGEARREPALAAPPAVPVPVEAPRPVVVVSGPSLAAQDVVDGLEQGGSVLTGPDAGWASGSPSLTDLVAQRAHDRDAALVVVQGGETDVALPQARVERAALEMADRLRDAFSPSTQLVLVGPVPDGTPDPALLGVRDALQRAATAKSVHFVDPVAEGWTSPADSGALVDLVQAYLEG